MTHDSLLYNKSVRWMSEDETIREVYSFGTGVENRKSIKRAYMSSSSSEAKRITYGGP